MAANNGYGLSYHNSLPGAVRGGYGTVNLGSTVGVPGYGDVRGEIFDGPQDEKMGIANYTPIVQNLPITYETETPLVLLTGELAVLLNREKKGIGGRRIEAMAEVAFVRGTKKPGSYVKARIASILPLASDFELGKKGRTTCKHAAFSVQSVADVMVPDTQEEHISFLPGDKVYAKLTNDNKLTLVKTVESDVSVSFVCLLGRAVLGFHTQRDKCAKICL